MKGIYQIISLESGSREKFIQFLDIFYSDKDNDCEGVPCTAARGIALRLGIEAREGVRGIVNDGAKKKQKPMQWNESQLKTSGVSCRIIFTKAKATHPTSLW
jgi:hypothetical protein